MHAALVIRFELMHFIISLTINWQLTLAWPEQKRCLTRICCQGLWELLDCKNFQLKTSSNIRLWVNLNLCLMRIYTVCFGEPEKIRSHYDIISLAGEKSILYWNALSKGSLSKENWFFVSYFSKYRFRQNRKRCK